jgi:hypothetical protein
VTAETRTEAINRRHLIAWAFVPWLPPLAHDPYPPRREPIGCLVSATTNDGECWITLPLWEFQRLGNIDVLPWQVYAPPAPGTVDAPPGMVTETGDHYRFEAVFFNPNELERRRKAVAEQEHRKTRLMNRLGRLRPSVARDRIGG